MSEPKKIICSSCNGIGIVGEVTREMAIDAGDIRYEGNIISCHECDGEGWIIEEASTIQEIPKC